MQKGERFRLVAVLGMVVALMSAGFALAGANTFDTSEEPPTTVCPPTGDAVEEGDPTGDTTGDTGDTTEEGDQGESEEADPEECEEPAEEADGSDDVETPDVEGDQQTAPEPSVERTAQCTEAAGLEATEAPTEKPVPGELKGLENAISHVLWNCMRNDNDGLVNALEHLSANLERKQLRDEAKAERKAAHDAAKTERKAAHEAAKAARALARAS
jgi:hypothetical protein